MTEVRSSSSSTSLQRVNSVKRAVLIPQKTNLKFEAGINLDHNHLDHNHEGGGLSARKASTNSLKPDSARSHHPATDKLPRASSRYAQNNPTIHVESPSDPLLFDHFLEQVPMVGLVKQDSTIMRSRIIEEMYRIQQRSQITPEERAKLFQIAMSMDAPKLARKLVADAKGEKEVQGGGGGTGAGGMGIGEKKERELMDSKPSPFLLQQDLEPAFLTGSTLRTASQGSLGEEEDDHFCKAFDEVERIRQRILQRAAQPLQGQGLGGRGDGEREGGSKVRRLSEELHTISEGTLGLESPPISQKEERREERRVIPSLDQLINSAPSTARSLPPKKDAGEEERRRRRLEDLLPLRGERGRQREEEQSNEGDEEDGEKERESVGVSEFFTSPRSLSTSSHPTPLPTPLSSRNASLPPLSLHPRQLQQHSRALLISPRGAEGALVSPIPLLPSPQPPISQPPLRRSRFDFEAFGTVEGGERGGGGGGGEREKAEGEDSTSLLSKMKRSLLLLSSASTPKEVLDHVFPPLRLAPPLVSQSLATPPHQLARGAAEGGRGGQSGSSLLRPTTSPPASLKLAGGLAIAPSLSRDTSSHTLAPSPSAPPLEGGQGQGQGLGLGLGGKLTPSFTPSGRYSAKEGGSSKKQSLLAALQAGDAVGKLMADMMLSQKMTR